MKYDHHWISVVAPVMIQSAANSEQMFTVEPDAISERHVTLLEQITSGEPDQIRQAVVTHTFQSFDCRQYSEAAISLIAHVETYYPTIHDNIADHLSDILRLDPV